MPGYDTTHPPARPIIRFPIHRLPQKIETDATNPALLLTVRSAGYMLVAEPRLQ